MQIRCGSFRVTADGEEIAEEWTEEVPDTWIDDMRAEMLKAAPKPDVMLASDWAVKAISGASR